MAKSIPSIEAPELRSHSLIQSDETTKREFFGVGLGSLRETQAIIELANLSSLEKIADETGASLYRLCEALR